MLTRSQKEAFYRLFSPLMRLNALIYRMGRVSRFGDAPRIHLGPGQRNYIDGWVNIDANMFTGRCDLWMNLDHRLPFRTGSVQAAYSHHMIEHLAQLEFHISEVFRCLKPGGVYRTGGPHGDNAIQKFVSGDASWFSDFPIERKSIGGRFENFIFCGGEHFTILTFSFLEELLAAAGFVNIRECKVAQETGYPELFSDCLRFEEDSDYEVPHTLIVEAEKPHA